MNVRACRRVCGRVRARVWAGGGALLLLAGAALLPPPPALLTTARFPNVAPRKLAHMLADFSTHIRLYPHLGSWSVEEESGNYSAWRYEVSYACGVRCAGRAAVLAADRHAAGPAHGPPASHTVRVSHRACTTPPLLPWPAICDEWETETEVVADGAGGALLAERARAACGAGRRLLPAAAPLSCRRRLRAQRDLHLQRLRGLLAGGA